MKRERHLFEDYFDALAVSPPHLLNNACCLLAVGTLEIGKLCNGNRRGDTKTCRLKRTRQTGRPSGRAQLHWRGESEHRQKCATYTKKQTRTDARPEDAVLQPRIWAHITSTLSYKANPRSKCRRLEFHRFEGKLLPTR